MRELATDGSSPKPGLLRLRSACMAVAAACLVADSACMDVARGGDPIIFLTIHTCFLYYNGRCGLR